MAKTSATIDIDSLRVAGEPNKYITMIDSNNGIRVHEAGAVDTNFVQINSSGMQIYKGGDSFDKQIASFGSETVIGTSDSSQIYLDEDEIRGTGIDGKAFFNFNGKGRENSIRTTATIYMGFIDTLISNPINKTLESSFINANSTNIVCAGYVTYQPVGGGQSGYVWWRDINITYGTSFNQQYSFDWNEHTYTITLTYDGIESFGLSAYVNDSVVDNLMVVFRVLANNTVTSPTYVLGSGTSTGAFGLSEGRDTTAYGDYSHAEGENTIAEGKYSHAEGFENQANGLGSHAEGGASKAIGNWSHAENNNTIASGNYSHAEGANTEARNAYSHSSGIYTKTAVQGGFVIGRYNQEDDGAYKLSADTSVVSDKEYYTKTNYGYYSRVSSPSGDPSAKSYYELKSSWDDRTLKAFVIGNGDANNARSNAFTVDWAGHIWAENYYPVNSIYVSSTYKTATDIADLMGFGTWELIDKQFQHQFITSGVVTRNTTNVTSIDNQVFELEGNHIWCRVWLTNKVQLNDDTKQLFTIDVSKIGVDGNTYSDYIYGWSDGGNGIVLANLPNSESGNDITVESRDVVTRGTATTYIAASNTIFFSFYIRMGHSQMSDAFCDKFYYKRIA